MLRASLASSSPRSAAAASSQRRRLSHGHHHRRCPVAAPAANAAPQPSSSTSTSFLQVQLEQKEQELASLIAPGKAPPPAAVVGRLRDEIVALQAAIDGAPPPPTFVSPEAVAKAKARAANTSSSKSVPRLLRPGASAKYVGGEYGGEEQRPKHKTPGGLPPPARRVVAPGPPTPVFEPALVTGRLVPWPPVVGEEGGASTQAKKKKGGAAV